MADTLKHYEDDDKTVSWHDSEMIVVQTPDFRKYKLAYHIDKEKGTVIELPGGECVSVKEAERAGWSVTFPKRIRDFELSEGSHSTVRMREKRAAAKHEEVA